MTTTPETTIVTRELVPEERRADFVDALFGVHFPMQLEPYIYTVTSQLSADYRGAYWHFHSLGNGGFYMAPESESPFRVQCPNGFEGVLSGDALGLVACLYAYSHLSFVSTKPATTTYARMYHRLREYVMEHAEVDAILQATD
jgi:hypothetical protein